MHGRIFEIEEVPFESEDTFKSFGWENISELPVGFEYVLDSKVPRDEEVGALMKHLGVYQDFHADGDSFVIGKNFKHDYFKKAFQQFKHRADKVTLDQFIDGDTFSMTSYYINKALEDKLAIRTYSGELGHRSLDFFIRQAKVGQRYYIGGIGDYKA